MSPSPEDNVEQQVPEPDAAEQQEPWTPESEDEEAEADTDRPLTALPTVEANEADVIEQSQSLPDDEDFYAGATAEPE
ncbi:MAG: hypothetical protein ACXVYY_18000 [Oryzihumus sp.]